MRRLRLWVAYKALNILMSALPGYQRSIIFGSWNTRCIPNDLDVIFEFDSNIHKFAYYLAEIFKYLGIDARNVNKEKKVFHYYGRGELVLLELMSDGTVGVAP